MLFIYCKPCLSDLDPMFCKTTAKTCQVSHLEPKEYVSMHVTSVPVANQTSRICVLLQAPPLHQTFFLGLDEASGWAGILPVESSHTVALWVLAGHIVSNLKMITQ